MFTKIVSVCAIVVLLVGNFTPHVANAAPAEAPQPSALTQTIVCYIPGVPIAPGWVVTGRGHGGPCGNGTWFRIEQPQNGMIVCYVPAVPIPPGWVVTARGMGSACGNAYWFRIEQPRNGMIVCYVPAVPIPPGWVVTARGMGSACGNAYWFRIQHV